MNGDAEQAMMCVPSAEAGALIESLIREGVAVRIRVLGRSMEPAICSGDFITLAPIQGRIRLGDMVMCRRGDGSSAYYIHRLVWRAGRETWRTKGDALRSLDPAVRRPDIIGRVQSVERSGTGARKNLEGIVAQLGAVARAGLSLAHAAWAWLTRG